MIDPDWVERQLQRIVTRGWPVLVIAVIGLGVLGIVGYHFTARLEDIRIAQSDNTTWLIAQSEVEALKLAETVIVARQGPMGAAQVADLRQAFDLFYSRINVINTHVNQSPILTPMAGDPAWRAVVQRTERLRALIDVPNRDLTADLPDIRAELVLLRGPLREFALEALSRLVDAATARRETLARLWLRSATLAVTLIVMLLVLSWGMLHLARRLRQRHHEVERAQSNLEQTLASSLDGVIVVRQDGTVLRVNPAAEAILGYTLEELQQSRDLLSLLLPEGTGDPATHALRSMILSGADSRKEGRIYLSAQRRDGSSIPVELALASDRDADGRLIYFAFLRDISDRVSYEATLREARDSALQAAEAKARFLAVMSHEMRTPLNGLIAALDLLRETTRLSARQARFLAVAEASAALALDQINDVLELTRLEGDAALEDLSDFNLCATVREMAEQVSPLAARQKNKISLDLPPEANCWLQGHRRSFLRVLLNLLGNAAKFTTGGTITLSVHVLDQPDGLSLVRVEISDTGIGIASEKLSTIFEPFETLDNGYDRVAEGTGLGLGIARRTVERMGGAIGVDSRLGEGSTFWFTAPMARVAPPGAKPDDAPDTEAAAAPTPQPPVQEILIVEDNPTNRIVLREMLRHLGQTVVEASNGSEAVELARHRRFDLIFMDVSMPGIDGVTASRQIRAGGQSAQARIVALTAHGLPEDLERFRRGGLTEILQKPVTIAQLVPYLTAQTPEPAGDDRAMPADFDVVVVGELRALLPAAQMRQLLDGILAEGDGFIAALEAGESGPALADRAHRLRGAASIAGAAGLAALLEKVESELQGKGVVPSLVEWREIWGKAREILPLRLLPEGENTTKA